MPKKKNKSSSPKAVVFDLDGTLVDSGKHVIESFRHALEPFGVEVTYELLEFVRTRRQNDLFEGILAKDNAEIALKRLSSYSLGAAARVELYPGLAETLQLLEDRGIPLGIWTGRDGLSAARILKHLNLTSRFVRVVAGCDVAQNKPHPEGLLKLVAHFGCLPGEVLMIGDHEHDIVGAKKAGCASALALWGRHAGATDPQSSPDLLFSLAGDLDDFFKNGS